MLLLTSTSDKIDLITGQAADIDVHASYVDWASATATPARKNTAITTATTTDIVLAPGSSTARNVKSLVIRNRDSSDSTEVTVRHTDGTTVVELWKSTLAPGEKLVWTDGRGWVQYEAGGAEKPSVGVIITKVLAADQSNSTTTPTEVTGLKIPNVGPGTYQFFYTIIYQAAATTTGVRMSVNHDGTVSKFVANMHACDTSATAATATPDQDAVGAAGQVYTVMAARAKSTAGWGTTLGVDTANADMLMIIEGTMIVTATGELEFWHGSEVAAQSTIMAGSSVTLTKVG